MRNRQATIKHSLRRGLIALVLLGCLLSTLPRVARAAEPPDATKLCSLALSCSYQAKTLEGMQIRAYRVADGTADTGFTLSGAFSSFPVLLSGLSASGWSTAAATLASYIEPNGIAATASAQSNAMGIASFSNLTQGMYLIVGDTLKIGRNSYFLEPFLIALPSLSKEGAWQYDVQADPKIVDPEEGLPDFYDFMILKQWEDEGATVKRPDSIEVALLRDGVVYDTRTLSATDNWRYTWTNLSNQYIWSALETTTLSGYTVTYQRSATTLVITNTATTSGDKEPVNPNIPYTGILWWPVYALAGAGLLLFVIGWRGRFGAKGEHDAP